MSDPLRQQATQMAFVERNDPIEAFTPCGADHSFAIGVRLRRQVKQVLVPIVLIEFALLLIKRW